MRERADYMSRGLAFVRGAACVSRVVWRTTCRLGLSPRKLSYQEPTRFSWHGAKEPAARKKTSRLFLFRAALIKRNEGELY